jgi:hypothetical protein
MTDADAIQFVIDEICEIDPSYRSAIRGAEEAEVQRLETLCGRPLPAMHRAFLRAMGAEWGVPLDKADFRASRLISYFETKSWRPPPGYTLIGLDNFGAGEDYFLDERGSPTGVVLFPKGTDPTVDGADASDCEIEAPSLPDFVFNQFFFMRHLRGSPAFIDAGKATDVEGAFAKTVEVLTRLGLTQHPRSGGEYVFYATPDVSVAVSQPQGYGLGVELSGRDAKRVEQIFAVLDDHVGLLRYPTD